VSRRVFRPTAKRCALPPAPLTERVAGTDDANRSRSDRARRLADAGAVSVGGIGLHLRGEVKDIWFAWLRVHRPDLIPLYERLYSRGAYLPPAERDRLSALASPKGKLPGRRFMRDRPKHAPPEPEPAVQERLF